MSAKRIFKLDDFLALLKIKSFSTGDIAKRLKCNRGTALKYLKELKAKKQVIETRITTNLNLWKLTIFGNPILIGDCAQTLKQLPDESVDLIVSDPPYGYNFMGLQWDRALPSLEALKECLRVLKSGAFAFFMCAPRQDVMSRMIMRLSKAGFIVNFTSIFWVYNTGFSKASDLSKIIDKQAGVEREIISVEIKQPPATNCYGDYGDKYEVKHTIPTTEEAKNLDGAYVGFQPKPATEPILVVMKSLSEKTYTAQALKNGKGCTWLDDCRIPWDRRHSSGSGQENYELEDRFPANILVSDDALNDGTVTKSQYGTVTRDIGSHSRYFSLNAWFQARLPEAVQKTFPSLVVPKPHKNEKSKYCQNDHPTVKPLKLMSYLIVMGSREGDIVLDPYCGSGTTLEAAKMLKRRFIGCELDPKWKPVIEARAYMR